MQKIFITSSGTSVGKTIVTCALAQSLINAGKSVHAIKPVISGFEYDTIPNDLFYICHSIGISYLQENLGKVNLFHFEKPLSPDMAARIEKKPMVDFNQLKTFCEKPLLKHNEYMLIETVGGVMVPLNENKTFLDLIKVSADKVVLVAGSYLGSLSHTLTAYKVLEDSGKKPAIIAVSQNLHKSHDLYIPVMQTIKSLEKFVTAPIIGLEKLTGAETTRINKMTKIFDDAKLFKFFS